MAISSRRNPGAFFCSPDVRKQYVRGVFVLSVALGWQDIQAAEKEIYMRTFFLMMASQTYSKI